MSTPFETAVEPEKAILVGTDRGLTEWSLDDSLDELERLTNTAGAVVVGRITQKISQVNPRTFIGTGKADEVARLAASLDADIIIFDDELTPTQQSNLEKLCPARKVIDRTALILDIFALHATTREGRLQVRLAQNQYLLPRLHGMWAHLASNRMGGGVGSRFGEGESQLEVDRRIVRKRITSIQRELRDLEKVRELQRKGRLYSGVSRISLAGYTNAGKSSTLNRLCGSECYVHDALFATLDSTTRKLLLPNSRQTTVTDTVGFIQKLPHGLVEAFKSTLAEIVQSDIILHIIDASSPKRDAQMRAVCDVLGEIGADKVPRIDVFNKADLLSDGEIASLKSHYPACVVVSAYTGYGFDELLAAIERAVSLNNTMLDILIPFSRGDLIDIAHENCSILNTEYTENGTRLSLLVPTEYRPRFKDFIVQEEADEERQDTLSSGDKDSES